MAHIASFHIDADIQPHFILRKAVSYEDLFWRIIWVGGVRKCLGKKNVFYEEIFPKNLLSKTLLRKKKLEYSQPRNVLAQTFPGDKRKFHEDIFGSLYNRTEINTK